MATKLTPAQLALLAERQGQFIDTYKPGLKLMGLGLIDAVKKNEGSAFFRWTINTDGETALSAQSN